jgi:hypothetical protein
MQKRKKDFDFLQMFAESDPDSAKVVYEITGMTPAELAQEIREDYAAGRSREQPWRWDQCRSWLDGWLYIYRRVQLDYHQHMSWEGERVRRIVWRGRSFNDAVVALLERLSGRLGINRDLEELRFIDTRVTPAGVKRLRRLFPKARITTYSEAKVKESPRLAFADPAEAAKWFPDAA